MTRFDVGSVSSRENLLDIQPPPSAAAAGSKVPRPRICKPWESRLAEDEEATSPPPPAAKGIRGRRRNLYSPPMKRATIPPAVPPKPSQAAAAAGASSSSKAARATSSPVTSPKLVRGTRTMALRQANAAAKKDAKPTSPKLSPRSFSSNNNNTTSGSSIGSPRSISSGGSPKSRFSAGGGGSRTQSPQSSVSSAEKPALVRQGTFTKDESPKKTPSSANNSSSGIPRSSPPAASATTGNFRQASSSSLRGSAGGSTRTPPKIAPKPTTFRRDTVQPCPAPKPLVATTKTQQLREKSLTRGGLRGSNSSTSSVASRASSTVSRTSIRTSSSSHSLRNAAAETPPKRTPSSSEIERRGTTRPLSPHNRPLSPHNRQYLSSGAGSRALSPSRRPPRAAASGPENFKAPAPAAAPKKDVTSKIASLWKKVEDTKKQKKDPNTPKDKRIWISKGKVLEPSPVQNAPPPPRLIRSGTYEKLSEGSHPSAPTSTSSATTSYSSDLKETKARSRSRLSIKLSKFGLKRKGAAASSNNTAEDRVNGNSTPVSPDELGNSLGSDPGLGSPSLDDVDDLTLVGGGGGGVSSPVEESSGGESMSTGPDSATSTQDHRRASPAAVVAPFNYRPQGGAVGAMTEHVRNAHLKRNSSYVSSMGRKQDSKEEMVNEEAVAATEQRKIYVNTSSSVVTLV